MKQLIKIGILSILILGMIPLQTIPAYENTVNDFNRIWYHHTSGFNKNNDGALVLATTYTNNTLRTIDSCSIEFIQEPFYFGISFTDNLERDNEGNIIEPKDGYFYLRKAVVQNFFPSDLRQLASKNLQYKTIEYAGDTWFQLHVPDFNKDYEWGTYHDPEIGERWYTWGNKESIRFKDRAMIIQKIKDSMGSLEFDITHNSDTSGQQISISKQYLQDKGINNPIFELNKKISLPYKETATHYLISPPHFSYLSLHEASSGTVNGSIPLRLKHTKDDGAGLINGFWANDTYLFLTSILDGVMAYTYNPSGFSLIDTQDDGGYYYNIWGNDTYIFTATSDTLRAYSFTGGSFTLEGEGNVNDYGTSVWANETYIYMTYSSGAFTGGLRAYTFNGTDFTHLASVSADGPHEKVYANDTYIYTACGHDGIRAYTFNGTEFTLLAEYTTGGFYRSVWCDDDFVYASCDSQGLRVFSFNGTEFTFLDRKDDGGTYYSNWKGNTYQYAANWDDGVAAYFFDGTSLYLKDKKHDSGWYQSCYVYNNTLFVGTSNTGIYAYNLYEEFNVTRTIGVSTETNNFTFTPLQNKTTEDGVVALRIPVSTQTKGIIDVTNNTCGTQATSVTSLTELINNTYWYDASDQSVYIGTINLTTSHVVDWTVNSSFGANFSIHIPPYLTVGEYLTMNGMIENSSGSPIDGLIAQTRVFYENGTLAIGDDPQIKWNCTNGNYETSISTATLTPGIYSVVISFFDPSTSISFNYGKILYLSYETPAGVYYDSTVIIRWYNTNLGLGLPVETLQLYIDGELQGDLNYETYAGNTINVTVKDYYENTLYENDFTINKNPYPIRLGLTFHEYDFTNMNEEYYVIGFLRENASRWFEKVVPSRGHEEFLIPTGNYTIRVYNADNSTYTSWDETVNNSKGYTIDGNTITEMIEGLSVVTGQILELQNDIDYALMPDEILWSVNPISVCSAFDKYGMMLGNNVWKVCPPKIVVATTRNNTYNGNITFHPLIPENDSSGDGSISVKEDILYFSGTATYVNITYTDNGTSLQNTTYVPSIVHLPGGEGLNITVNCSNDLFMLRETTYHQQKKFYWDIWNSTNNQGYISNRGGYHRTSIDVVNSLNTSLYNVRVLAGFSNKTTPDLSTARVTDVHNDVVTDDQSDDFKTTGSGIEFQIDGGIPASTTRNFVLEYYGSITSNYVYSDVQREILPGYKTKLTIANDNQFYNFEEIRFHNTNNVGFKGDLLIRFNIPIDVDSKSIKVQDMDNNRMLESNEYIPSRDFVQISNAAIGTLSAGGVRTFGIYWQEELSMGSDPGTIHLDTVLFNLAGIFPFTPFIGLCLAMCVPICAGAYNLGKRRRWDKKSLSLMLFGGLMIAFFFMLQAIGY